MPANVIMLGAAYQHGCLPVSASAIERALQLNGAAVDVNLAAFAWGRAAAAAPEAVAAAIGVAALGSGRRLDARRRRRRRRCAGAWTPRSCRRSCAARWNVAPPI